MCTDMLEIIPLNIRIFENKIVKISAKYPYGMYSRLRKTGEFYVSHLLPMGPIDFKIGRNVGIGVRNNVLGGQVLKKKKITAKKLKSRVPRDPCWPF